MSMPFSDTTTYKGLVQMYEEECGFEPGDISGNTRKLRKFTAEVNQALDDFFALALPASGTWQFDDSNQTDYPIIKTNIVSGQRDYPFTTDENGNLILDIYKVMIMRSAVATTYEEITPVDAQSEYEYGDTNVSSENTTGGMPCEYDKTANGIFLNPIPNYNATNGLKLYINREASYFVYTDTDKKPGVPGLFHKYFYLKPAQAYARRNSLANAAKIDTEIMRLEGVPEKGIVGSIARYFGHRIRDERKSITTKPITFR